MRGAIQDRRTRTGRAFSIQPGLLPARKGRIDVFHEHAKNPENKWEQFGDMLATLHIRPARATATMATFAQLQAQIAKLQGEAERLRKQEVSEVVARIKDAIETYGISQDELFGSRHGSRKTARGPGTPAKGTVGVPMYRDPATGKTWTGRGKPPTWIAGVSDRTPFMINSGASANPPQRVRPITKAVKSTVGEPKYRDPATGNTWTGRGKPPNWIAGAADRTPFLIMGAPAAKASPDAQQTGVANGRGGPRAGAKKGRRAAKPNSARARGRRSGGNAGDNSQLAAEARTPSA